MSAILLKPQYVSKIQLARDSNIWFMANGCQNDCYIEENKTTDPIVLCSIIVSKTHKWDIIAEMPSVKILDDEIPRMPSVKMLDEEIPWMPSVKMFGEEISRMLSVKMLDEETSEMPWAHTFCFSWVWSCETCEKNWTITINFSSLTPRGPVTNLCVSELCHHWLG